MGSAIDIPSVPLKNEGNNDAIMLVHSSNPKRYKEKM